MPFSPDDYMGGSRAPLPASFSAPLVGGQIGAQLAGLPQQYAQGQQLQMATRLREAFPEGLPRNADGTIDSNAILNKVVGISGLGPESLGPLMTLSARQAVAAGDVPPGGASATSTPPPTPTARSWLGLGNSPIASNDATGDVNTIRGVATEVFGDTDVSKYLPRYSAALKVADADTPLSQDQITVARRLMGKSAAYLRSQPSQSPVSSDEGVTQRSGNTYGSDYAYNGGAGTPTSSGASGSPGPSASGAGPSSAPLLGRSPAPQGPQTFGTQPAEPAAGGGVRMQQPQRVAQAQPGADLVPPQLRHMSPPQAAAWLMARAQRHSEIGDVEGAKLLAQQAQTIQDSIKQAAEVPNEVKIAQSQGMTPLQYEAAKTQQGKDIDVYSKLNTGVQSMANTGVAMLPTLQAADSLLSAGAATGWASDKILAGKQILARIGGDPNGAMTLEAFGKQMAAFINQQTNTLKSEAMEIGGTGRIFAQMVENMQKASPSPDYTPAGNRYLIEVYRRGIQRSVEIADMANRYKNQYGRLDGNFEAQARTYQINNPMFTEAEVADPRRVAPPVVRSMDDLRAIGWRDGEPFRSAVSGKIFTHVPKGM
jgi:hypothetical protein